MSSMHRGSVVVGLDGSPPSTAALDWAVEEASRRHLPLHLVHALALDYSIGAALMSSPEVAEIPARLPQEQADQDRVLTEAVERARHQAPDVSITTQLVSGIAAPWLVDLSAQADTVVVGSHGRGALGRTLIGSVSIDVAMHAQCPVVVVRQSAATTVDVPRIVVGIDGSEVSQEAVGYAFAQASTRRLPLTAIHVWAMEFVEGMITSTSSQDQWQQAVDEQHVILAESLAGWQEKYPDVAVTHTVRRGHPVQVLVDAAQGSELLVVGSRGRGGFRGLLLGSVSQTILHHAHCPVAVVRPGTKERSKR